MVCEPSFETLTRSFLPSVMPFESSMEAAGSLPLGAMKVLPSAITVTGPSGLITSPPVSWLYTFLMSTVMRFAATSFCSKKAMSCSALSATVQNGICWPSIEMVVW